MVPIEDDWVSISNQTKTDGMMATKSILQLSII